MKKQEMISVIGLNKQFNKKEILKNVSFKVTKGSVALFLGPNGAGKTTTIKSLIGALNYQGEILIDGLDSKSVEGKRKYSFVPDNSVFPKAMKTLAYLTYMGYLSGMSMKESKTKSKEILKKLNMEQYSNSFPNSLSAGQRKIINIAQALLLDPELIIMDEPSANLDVDTKSRLIKVIERLNKEGKTFFISTHAIKDFQEIATEVVIIDNHSILLNKIVKKKSNLMNVYEKTIGGKHA